MKLFLTKISYRLIKLIIDLLSDSKQVRELGLENSTDEGKIKNLPGVDLEYQQPNNAKLVFKPEENEMNIDKILDFWLRIKFIR